METQRNHEAAELSLEGCVGVWVRDTAQPVCVSNAVLLETGFLWTAPDRGH